MADVIELGSRLELLVDDFLLDEVGGLTQRLHSPTPQADAFVLDAPWEGAMCGYVTIFRDDDGYRMYYRGWHVDLEPGKQFGEGSIRVCLALSDDGIHWTRPNLGLYEYEGSKENNIVWYGVDQEEKCIHGFTPFRDPNPDCDPSARYKAVGGIAHATRGALYAAVSPDGVHWQLMQDKPIITTGKFDSQNLVFWDSVRGEYRAYVRDFENKCRGIRTATSPDFVTWSEPEWLDYPDAPTEQLYTNQVIPYYRAPHIFVGFPTRYNTRDWSPTIEALPQLEHRRLRSSVQMRYGTDLTDGLFMSSRDGRSFKRWGEAFLRPGLRSEGSWVYGDMYQCHGLIETKSALPGAPDELSFYATERYWRDRSTLFRRYTLRVDGFVSMNAPLAGGGFVTKPVTFDGDSLALNISTSAGGGAWVELQTPDGTPIESYTLDDCHEIVGDNLAYTVRWRNTPDLTSLRGKPLRLRVRMKDADLYSLRFA